MLPCVYASGQNDTLSLLFIGDLMQHDAQLDAARRSDGSFDYSACFAEVSSEIKRADIAVGNLEVPLGGKPYSGGSPIADIRLSALLMSGCMRCVMPDSM